MKEIIVTQPSRPDYKEYIHKCSADLHTARFTSFSAFQKQVFVHLVRLLQIKFSAVATAIIERKTNKFIAFRK